MLANHVFAVWLKETNCLVSFQLGNDDNCMARYFRRHRSGRAGSDPEATVNEIAEQLPDKNIVLDCAGNEVLPSVIVVASACAARKSRDFG